jgi:hypothetical protein
MTGLGGRLGPPGRMLVRALHAMHPPVAKVGS